MGFVCVGVDGTGVGVDGTMIGRCGVDGMLTTIGFVPEPPVAVGTLVLIVSFMVVVLIVFGTYSIPPTSHSGIKSAVTIKPPTVINPKGIRITRRAIAILSAVSGKLDVTMGSSLDLRYDCFCGITTMGFGVTCSSTGIISMVGFSGVCLGGLMICLFGFVSAL